MNISQKIRDILKLFPKIKPKEAAEKLEIPYTKSFCNTFYMQKKLPQKLPKDTNKKETQKRETVSHLNSTSQKTENPFSQKTISNLESNSTSKNSVDEKITMAKLKSMSIKSKLKLASEGVLDSFLLTGIATKSYNKSLDILMNPEFIEQGEPVRGNIYWTSETPPYERPKFLYDHQLMSMKLMELGHLLHQASRQLAGKTTAGLTKDFEDMLDYDDYTIALVSPSINLSRELLNKWLYSPIKYEGKVYRFYDIIRPYLKKEPNADGFILKNGSRLMIISLKYSSSQGRTIDVIHIEELDKLTSEQSKREALAGLIGSLRANPEAKIRCFCNNLTGIFRLLKSELFKFGRYFSIFLEDPYSIDDEYSGRHTIINEDVIVDRKPKLDEILMIFYEILVSTAFALGQLYNIDLATDECFNPDKVENAYKERPDKIPIYKKTTMGIDPGGKIDAFGVSIWSLNKQEDIELRWVKRYYNALHDYKILAKETAENYIRYNVDYCQAESSAGSAWILQIIADEVDKQSNGTIKFRYVFVNFEGEGKTFDKSNFVYLFKILLDNGTLILHDRNQEERELHRQITLYIPAKSESSNNPDDLIESGFHGIWNLVGGMSYIKKLIDKITAPVGATTQE